MTQPEPTTTVAAASGITKALITALPPTFLLLCITIGGLFWLVLHSVELQGEQRLTILTTVIEKCLSRQTP